MISWNILSILFEFYLKKIFSIKQYNEIKNIPEHFQYFRMFHESEYSYIM
jgi:hypothetical protein